MFSKSVLFLATAVGVMLTLVLGVGGAASLPRRYRLQQLARARNPEAAFADFCAAFPDQSVERLKPIYSSIQQVTGFDGFPIRAEDDTSEAGRRSRGVLGRAVVVLIMCRWYQLRV